MQSVRHHLLARTALALYQDRDVDVGQLANRVEDPLHRHVAADDAAEALALIETPSQVNHLGHVAENHQRAGGRLSWRFGGHDRHLEIAPFSGVRDERAGIAHARRLRLVLAGAERAVAAAETLGEHFVAVATDDLGVGEPGDPLRRTVEEVDPAVQVVRQDAVGEVVEQRAQGQPDLVDRLEEAVLKEPLHALADFVADLAEDRVGLRRGGLLLSGRVGERPVDPRRRAGEGRAELPRVVAERDNDVERFRGDGLERPVHARADREADFLHDAAGRGRDVLADVAGGGDLYALRRDPFREGGRHLAAARIPGADEEDAQHPTPSCPPL